MNTMKEESLEDAQLTIRLLQEELAATNREVMLLTLELDRRVEERTAQLEESNRDLEAFSYSISHDLRAPLRRLLSFAEVFRQHVGAQLDEEGRHLLGRITDNAKRMSDLIEGLLHFSRSSHSELNKQPVDLNLVVGEVVRELVGDLRDREITWEIGPLPQVSADPLLLRQVLVNVIANAIKYTRRRPRARIEIDQAPSGRNEVVWFVRDNGVGFDMNHANHLFGVFQRLHRETEFEGTGVGLATARRIMSRHGGRIWAEAQPDQGATFYLALPCG